MTIQAHTQGQFGVATSPIPHMRVFGLWEEAGGPGENAHGHRENRRTPHRKAPHSYKSDNHNIKKSVLRDLPRTTDTTISSHTFVPVPPTARDSAGLLQSLMGKTRAGIERKETKNQS